MKKYLLSVLAVALTSWAWAFQVQSPSGHMLNYSLLNGSTTQVVVSSIEIGGYTYNGSLTIPPTVTYEGTTYTVVAVGGWNSFTGGGFAGLTGLTSVTIPSTVVSIGGQAFYGCTGLSSVTLGGSVTYIGSGAFRNCTALTGINLGSQLTELGSYAFSHCLALTSVSLPDATTSLGSYAFDSCVALTSATLGSGLQTIGEYAFRDCRGLTGITIPQGVTSIGNRVFWGCTGLHTVAFNADSCVSTGGSYYGSPFDTVALTSVSIGANVRQVPDALFYRCGHLAQATMAAGLRRIGWGAFYGCRSLASVTIPATVTYVGAEAFRGCASLASATWSPACDTIQSQTFYGCAALEEFTVHSTMKHIWGQPFGGCSNLRTLHFNADSCRTDSYSFDTNLTALTLGANVRYVPSYFAAGCRHLATVTIPDAVTRIDDDAFYGCTGLTSLSVGRGVRFIGYGAFSNIGPTTLYYNADSLGTNYYSRQFGTAITTLHLGSHVRYIPNGIFRDCKQMAGALVLPAQVREVGDNAFYDCEGLYSITLPAGLRKIGSNAFGSIDSLVTINYNVVGECQVPSSNSPFYHYDYYGSSTPHDWTVNIGSNVTHIPAHLFDACYYVAEVNFGPEVASVGTYAFRNCSRIRELVLPASLQHIGQSAFCNIDSLRTVTLPTSLDTLRYDYFQGCTRLTGVKYAGDVRQWCRMVFVDSPIGQPYDLGFGSTLAEHLTLPVGVARVPAYAFSRCRSLRSVNTGFTAAVVGQYAFYQCDSLRQVTLGMGCDSVGYAAFVGCSRVDSVAFRPMVPPRRGNSSVFSVGGNTPVSVPCGAGGAYAASNWYGTFYNFIEAGTHSFTVSSVGDASGAVDILQAPTCDNPYAVVEARPSCAHAFLRWSDNTTTNPHTLLVASDIDLVAYFALSGVPVHTLIARADDPLRGSVSGGGRYGEGSVAVLAAMPHEGYLFDRWQDGNTDNPRSVNVAADATYTALFSQSAPTVYTLATSVEGMGTVQGGGSYAAGALVALQAVPFDGHAFASWQDGCTDNPRIVAVDGDATYTATFQQTAPVVYALNVVASNAAQGSVSGSGSYAPGAEVVVAATPLPGYRFLHWQDDNADNPRTVVVETDATYTAFFEVSDEPQQDIMATDREEARYALNGRRLVVSQVQGRSLRVVDAVGRVCYSCPTAEAQVAIDLPAAGLYLLQVGGGDTHRIIVIE